MSKINTIEDKDAKLRAELDELFNKTTGNISSNSVSDFLPEELPTIDSQLSDVPRIDIASEIANRTKQEPQVPRTNVLELDKRFKNQAKKVIESMYDFYLGYGVIDKPEYLEKRKALDTVPISSMLLQLKMVKDTLVKVYEEINDGNTNPKVIESFCSLNKSMSELTKDQVNYMIFLEEVYKKAKIEAMDYNAAKNLAANKKTITQDIVDIEELKEEEPVQQPTSSQQEEDFFITSDPLVLMEEINKCDMTDEEIKNQRSDYLKERGDVSRYVSHSNKNDLVEEYDVDAATIKAEDEMDDDSDLLQMI